MRHKGVHDGRAWRRAGAHQQGLELDARAQGPRHQTGYGHRLEQIRFNQGDARTVVGERHAGQGHADLDADVRCDARFAEVAVDVAAQQVLRQVGDDGIGLQFMHIDLAAPGQRVIVAHHAGDTGADQHLGLHFRVDHRFVGDAQLDLAAGDALHHLRRGHRLQRHARARPLGDKSRHRLGEIAVGDRKRACDRQCAQSSPGEILYQATHRIKAAVNGGDIRKNRHRLGRWLQPSAAARE